jgi:hypothetical protein
MNSLFSLMSVNRPCDQALDWLSACLGREGMHLLRTFDLHDARLAFGDCSCPHHGTGQCDCQMVVVLVYGKAPQPATLVLHGSDGQTWLSIVNNPLQRPDPSMQSRIEQALRLSPLE